VKRPLLNTWVAVAAVAGLAGLARADNAVYACTDASGRLELSNAPGGNHCEKLLSGPEAPAQAAAAAAARAAPSRPSAGAPAAATARASAAPVRPALVPPPQPTPQPRNDYEARLAQTRDASIQQTSDAYASGQPSSGINRAVGRRYLMINRSDYQRGLGMLQ